MTWKDDLLSGWGLRTLSSLHPAYDPISYHNGGVWPHDTSIVAAGLKRYGLVREAATLAQEMLEAALTFPQARLPEVYTAFKREPGDTSVPIYPDTCTIQAWAAGTPFLLLSVLLGLAVNQPDQKMTFHAPRLPDGVRKFSVSGIKPWPSADVSAAFERTADQPANAVTLEASEGVQVDVSPETQPASALR